MISLFIIEFKKAIEELHAKEEKNVSNMDISSVGIVGEVKEPVKIVDNTKIKVYEDFLSQPIVNKTYTYEQIKKASEKLGSLCN